MTGAVAVQNVGRRAGDGVAQVDGVVAVAGDDVEGCMAVGEGGVADGLDIDRVAAVAGVDRRRDAGDRPQDGDEVAAAAGVEGEGVDGRVGDLVVGWRGHRVGDVEGRQPTERAGRPGRAADGDGPSHDGDRVRRAQAGDPARAIGEALKVGQLAEVDAAGGDVPREDGHPVVSAASGDDVLDGDRVPLIVVQVEHGANRDGRRPAQADDAAHAVARLLEVGERAGGRVAAEGHQGVVPGGRDVDRQAVGADHHVRSARQSGGRRPDRDRADRNEQVVQHAVRRNGVGTGGGRVERGAVRADGDPGDPGRARAIVRPEPGQRAGRLVAREDHEGVVRGAADVEVPPVGADHDGRRPVQAGDRSPADGFAVGVRLNEDEPVGCRVEVEHGHRLLDRADDVDEIAVGADRQGRGVRQTGRRGRVDDLGGDARTGRPQGDAVEQDFHRDRRHHTGLVVAEEDLEAPFGRGERVGEFPVGADRDRREGRGRLVERPVGEDLRQRRRAVAGIGGRGVDLEPGEGVPRPAENFQPDAVGADRQVGSARQAGVGQVRGRVGAGVDEEAREQARGRVASEDVDRAERAQSLVRVGADDVDEGPVGAHGRHGRAGESGDRRPVERDAVDQPLGDGGTAVVPAWDDHRERPARVGRGGDVDGLAAAGQRRGGQRSGPVDQRAPLSRGHRQERDDVPAVQRVRLHQLRARRGEIRHEVIGAVGGERRRLELPEEGGARRLRDRPAEGQHLGGRVAIEDGQARRVATPGSGQIDDQAVGRDRHRVVAGRAAGDDRRAGQRAVGRVPREHRQRAVGQGDEDRRVVTAHRHRAIT